MQCDWCGVVRCGAVSEIQRANEEPSKTSKQSHRKVAKRKDRQEQQYKFTAPYQNKVKLRSVCLLSKSIEGGENVSISKSGTMVKGWADHCSSDEEEEEEPAVVVTEEPAPAPAPAEAEAEPEPEPNEQEEAATAEPAPDETAHKERVYEYPTEPPFMAYVGNLAYSLTDPKDLAAEVQALASEKLSASINVLHARVMKDRQNNDRPRGFGYVEVETLEMLKQLMELNTTAGEPKIAGRRVTFDVSNYSGHRRNSSHRNNNGDRRSSESSIDGAKFRGGRYANNNPRASGGGGPPATEESSSSATPRDPAAQRPSLKLKPRTKPVEDGDLSGSQSNIFGGAKARDETTWMERRSSETKQASTAAAATAAAGRGGDSTTGDQKQHRRDSGHNKGRGGRGRGEGGRGRGEGGRGRGRGEGGRGETRGRGEKGSFREKKKSEKPHAPAPAPKPAPPPEPEKAPPKKPTVTNAFAALAMDSDSD